jgi:hypothetical protein
MKPRFAHILAFGLAAWSTITGFKSALQVAKATGFNTFTVLPMLFEGTELTKQQVVAAAKEYDMKLVACGFLPGDKFSPYTEDGCPLAIAELRKQFEWQHYFNKNGVGDRSVCGPIFDAWRAGIGVFNEEGFVEYVAAVMVLMTEMNLTVAVEIVNKDESSVPDAHIRIPQAIVHLNNNRVRLHADTVHISTYVGMDGVIDFLKEHREIIGIVELGMPGRLAMKKVPEFVAIAKELFAWLAGNLPDVSLGVEQFDYETVILAFGIEKIYISTEAGIVVFNADASFLLEHGVLE